MTAHPVLRRGRRDIFSSARTLEDFACAMQTCARHRQVRVDGVAEALQTLAYVVETPGIVRRDGFWLEFGVGMGERSLRYLASKKGEGTRLVGFDSFEGLPEAWREGYPKGHFRRDSVSPVPGAELIIGIFERTLPSFDPEDDISLVHLDCDLYSSAKTVLDWFFGEPHDGKGRLTRTGSVLVFDELVCRPYENGEMRALYEAQREFGFSIDVLASESEAVAIHIL